MDGPATPPSLWVRVIADDRFRAEIIERLMCDFAVDLAEVCAAHHRPLADLDGSVARLAPMQADGIALVLGPRVEATQTGRDFIRSICAVFDAHLEQGATRHSASI